MSKIVNNKKVYTIKETQSLLGCEGNNYVHQLVKKGKLHIVGEEFVNNTKVKRVLLDGDEVDEYVRNKRVIINDGKESYRVRLSKEELEQIKQILPHLEFNNETERMRLYHQNKKNEENEE